VAQGPAVPEAARQRVSDEELARAFTQEGDRAALVTLVERYRPSLRRLLSSLFNGAADDADDAEQEVVTELLRGIGRFRFESSFRTFLYRLCRNTAIDLLRRTARARRRDAAAAQAALRDAEAGPEALFDPDAALLAEDRRRAVGAALARLAPDDRALLVMKEVDAMGIVEIAAVLRVPAGTVKSRLFRTREKLAVLLGDINEH
jgi:RNA polymerase sigma-70 factor, ECF subfamily